jgi:hypothetical protein
MKCYLCGSESRSLRKGVVRDALELSINECDDCGLVSLSQTEHITAGFYENSGIRYRIICTGSAEESKLATVNGHLLIHPSRPKLTQTN